MTPSTPTQSQFVRFLVTWLELAILGVLTVAATVAHVWFHVDNFETIIILDLLVLATICGSVLHFRLDLSSERKTMDVGLAGLKADLDLGLKDLKKDFDVGLKGLNLNLDSALKGLKTNTADSFFASNTSEQKLLAEAENEVWLIQESGSLIAEQRQSEIQGLLRRGGKVRIVVALPCLLVARFLGLRNESLDHGDLRTRFEVFAGRLSAIADKTAPYTTGFEVRYLPYPVGTTAVFVDPEHPEAARRLALIRHAGFRVPFDHKLDHLVDAETSPRVFKHYFQEARDIYLHSTKIVLITAAPKSGKTSLLRGIVEELKSDTHLYYAISPEKRDGPNRVGFCVETSKGEPPVQFASKRINDTRYTVVPGVWKKVSEDVLNAVGQGKVLVLDEIGPLQIDEPQFPELIDKILGSTRTTLIATIAKNDEGHKCLARFKQHHRTALLDLDELGRDKVASIVREELKAALKTAHILPYEVLGE